MKHLKILGLTAIAAMVLMALGGVGVAQAAFYTDSAKTVKYAAGTVIDLSLKSGSATKLTNGSETVATCTESTAKGKTSEAGETVSVGLETLTWGGCSTTTDTLTNGKLEITWTTGGNGEVVGQESKWTTSIFGVSCTYGFGEGTKLGTLVGGETPTLKIESLIAKTAGGFLCPSAVTWDAEYVVTEPHALYVGPAPVTSLFTDSGKTTRYPTSTVVDLSLKSGTSTTLMRTGAETLNTCTGSTAKGKTSNETGEAISVSIETLTWSGCNTTTDTLATGKFEVAWISGSNGEVIGKETQWTVNIFGVSCTYGFGAGTRLGTLTAGETPTLEIKEVGIKKIAGGFLCPEAAQLNAEYVVTEPHALYLGGFLRPALLTDSAKTVRYPIGTVVDLSLESGATTRFTSSGGETIATCTESTVKGKESTETNLLNLETLTWSGCSQTTDTLATGKLEITATSGGNGEVVGQESRWTFGIFGVSCSYGFGEGAKLGTLAGGETPTLKIEALIPRTAGGVLCPTAVTWDANYVVTEPHALYVG